MYSWLQKYLDAAEADKERYQKEMEEYKRSEAYKMMMKKKKKQGGKSKHPFGQVNEVSQGVWIIRDIRKFLSIVQFLKVFSCANDVISLQEELISKIISLI